MLQKLHKRNQGFTIIEVLIVLAIAGLILLIVFLAVPALQRNARNTQRKNDVASLLGAMTEYTNNQGGTFPASCANLAACQGTFAGNAHLGTVTTLTFTNQAAAAVPAAPAALDSVVMANFAKCASPPTSGTVANASARSLIALYLVETGGGTQLECTESGS
jgi:prepilin-type N-terminal cleavage/methylation domain-containing protein